MGAVSGVSGTMPPGADADQHLRLADANQHDALARAQARVDRAPRSRRSRAAPASLKRFSTQLMAKISATMAIRLKVSCARLPTDKGEAGCASPVIERAPSSPSRSPRR